MTAPRIKRENIIENSLIISMVKHIGQHSQTGAHWLLFALDEHNK